MAAWTRRASPSRASTDALAVPTADLRLFGKPESFERRRMGVALARGETTDQARERAREAAARVKPVRG